MNKFRYKYCALIPMVFIIFTFVIYFESYYIPEVPILYKMKLKMCYTLGNMKTCHIDCTSVSCSDTYYRFLLERGEDFLRKDFIGDYKCFDKENITKSFDEDSEPYFFLHLRKEAYRVCVEWDFDKKRPTGLLFLENIEGRIIEISDWYTLHP